MFGIGVPELIIILIIGLIVFGPGKLPELGRSLGKTIREFRKVSNGIMDDEPVEKSAKKLEASTGVEKVDETAESSSMVDDNNKQ
jgi:sec-independent protein translocase protein TatA